MDHKGLGEDMDAIADAIAENFKSEFSTWLVAVVIGILGVFSSYLTERIKAALNRADGQAKTYEELSSELSRFSFLAESIVEFVGKGWTTKTTLTDLLTKYNEAVSLLRENEYKYVAEVSSYWGNDNASRLRGLLQIARRFDTNLRVLNDEFEAVNITQSKPKVAPDIAREWLKDAQPILTELCSATDSYLTQLRL